MELSVQADDGNLLRLKIRGRITQIHMPADLTEAFLRLLGPCGYARRVLVDLSESEFIDSSGLSWLVLLQKRFREAKGQLILHSIPVRVLEIIRVMSLDRVLRIAEDEPAAMAILQGESG